MRQYYYVGHSEGDTLGEIIQRRFADFEVVYGKAPFDMDTTHGVEISTYDNTKYGHGIDVYINPFIEWTDGSWRPCHYWGPQYEIHLHKQ